MNIIKKIKKYIFIRNWRKANLHNETYPANFFDSNTVSIGKRTYGPIRVFNDVRECKLVIGNYCSIGDDVTFLVGIEHDYKNISTYPFKVNCCAMTAVEAVSKGDIIVEDDVWIGYGATILSGVHIGRGAVIAAGAVVAKNVPPYAIAGGVPATIIKYRFKNDIIKELLKVDFSQLDDNLIATHIDDLYIELTDVNQLSWLPKK